MNVMCLGVFLVENKISIENCPVFLHPFVENKQMSVQKLKILVKKHITKTQYSQPFVLAVDFDGTLCDKHEQPIYDICDFIKKTQEEFNKFELIKILTTCRSGSSLKFAKNWLQKQGLVFDYINENADFYIDKYGDCRKIFCNMLIDNTSYNFSEKDFLNCFPIIQSEGDVSEIIL